jgi:hypothetical protein
MLAPIQSTLHLRLQVVVLIVLFTGISYARRGTNEGFKMHGRLMATAIVLSLVGVILVMIPSLLLFLSTGKISTIFFAIDPSRHIRVFGTRLRDCICLQQETKEPEAMDAHYRAVLVRSVHLWLVELPMGLGILLGTFDSTQRL